MNNKSKQIILLTILILLLILINYSFIDNFLIKTFENPQSLFVSRIIDGDTIEADNLTIRLMGINCPERGEKYYLKAKEFLENSILNKPIQIESFGKDRYYRELAYIFYKTKNIDIQLVENGLANIYILENKKYKKQLNEAWEKCLKKNINLCEKSQNKCVECIQIKKFNYKDDFVIFENICNFNCNLNNWSIKDEGRKKYIFENTNINSNQEIKITSEDFNQNYVWTDTGDTLFLRDDQEKLVLWKNY